LAGFVLDAEKKEAFFGGRKKKAYDVDLMQSWWSRSELEYLAFKADFGCEFSAIDPSLDASRYRFNALLSSGSSE